ncbi:cyclic AMP-responsive element-binding protein 3 isoform 2-T3 [Dugong dugon]
MCHMELALGPSDQDLLDFLLEESGDLRVVPEEAVEAPLDWERPLSEPVYLNPVQVLSDWEAEEFLSSLLSPPASLKALSSSIPCPVRHDHNYSLPQEHVSIDLDNGSCEKEEAQMTPLQVKEPAEQPKEIENLILTEEEKRLLEKEGLSLPRTLPLTKEEQALKRVRRKIRNKRSAQESRRKKKVYVGGLESRILKYTTQNLELQNRVQLLEEENMSLLDQLSKLQAMVIQISNQTSSSSTCVLVLLFSFCLLLVPAMYSSDMRSLPTEHRVLSRQLRSLPSEDPHQLELPALQSEVPKDSTNQLLNNLDHFLQAPGNSCCFLNHVAQDPGAEPPLKLTLSDPFSMHSCLSPILPQQTNLTRKGGWLPTHSPSPVILQVRYSG